MEVDEAGFLDGLALALVLLFRTIREGGLLMVIPLALLSVTLLVLGGDAGGGEGGGGGGGLVEHDGDGTLHSMSPLLDSGTAADRFCSLPFTRLTRPAAVEDAAREGFVASTLLLLLPLLLHAPSVRSRVRLRRPIF